MSAIETWLGHPWVARLGWCLVHSVWEIAAVGLVGAVVLRVLRRGPAQARYLAACVALVLMSALPVSTLVWLAGSRVDEGTTQATVGAPRAGDVREAAALPRADPGAEPGREELLIRTDPPREQARPRLSEQLEPWLPILVAGWGMGVFVLSVRLLGGWLVLQGLIRRGARPVEGPWAEVLARLSARLDLRREVRLLESARSQVPMVVGWWRPVILLPATALTGLPSDQLALILGHELAHIRRHDYLVNLVQSVIETLLFFHPAIWWISARIREERENCCDDRAVELCGDRLDYARALAALEAMRVGSWSLAPSARGGTLLARIQRLMGVAPVEPPPARGLAGTLALMILAFLDLVLFVAPWTTTARAAAEDRKVVTGIVRSTDGRPVAGADVWLVAQGDPRSIIIVIDRSRCDETGHFRLTWDETRFKGRHLGAHAVWAHRPGSGPGRAMFVEPWTDTGVDPQRPIELTLGPAVSSGFRIIGPDGKPLAGARVAVVQLREDRTGLPDELAERLAASTDRDGQATLQTAPHDLIGTVQVTTRDHGDQRFDRENGFLRQNELRLLPVVPVEGRVTADDPAAIRGLPLHMEGMAKVEEGSWVSSLADAVSDARGRFSVPRIVPGYLHIEAEIPETSVYRQVLTDNNFEGARKIEVTVPLERWVRVRGLVREKGTGSPVEGVGLRFSNRNTIGPISLVGKTDASGRFEAIAPRGKETFCHPDIPPGFIKLVRGIEMPEITADGQVLPPIELERGATLRGIVVDENGRTVAGASVVGKWNTIGPGIKAPNGATMFMGSNFSAKATTDARGEFLLEGIHPGANMMLEAQAGEARTAGPQPAGAGTPVPVKLMIAGANTVSLEGKVIHSTGEGVAGVLVKIRSRPLGRDSVPDPGKVGFGGEDEIRTDEVGHFRTPRRLKRGFAFRAEVQPDDPGLMSDSSPWLALGPETRPVLQGLVLRRLRIVEGRVVDSQGRPAAGATVRQSGDGPVPTQAATDEDGRFRLSGVLAEPAFLFVAKEGYRFQGMPIGVDSSPVEIRIFRTDEPRKPMTTLPSSLSRSAELKLVHLLFDAYADRVIRQGTRNERWEVFHILTQLDPGRALDLIRRNDFAADLEPVEFRRGEAAVELMKKSPDEALDLIAAIRDPNARSYAYEQAARSLPDGARARKPELLTESLVAGRAIVEPADRVLRLANLGRLWIDLGQSDQGSRLLREAQEVARRLPTTGWSAFARGNLAEELAPIDLPAALDLLKGTEEVREHEQHLGHIAHRLADKSPADAERVLMTMRDHWPYFRDDYTQRVCYRMMAVDPDRAKALAGRMTNYRHKARALGAMALAVSRSKRDRAEPARLLAEAFAVLDQAAGTKEDQWDGLGMACTAAAGLLPIVEQIDPGLVPEYLWRTLALRPPLRSGDSRDGIVLIANTRVAAMVARYDHQVARQIFAGLADRELARVISLPEGDRTFELGAIFTAAPFVDPLRAGALLARLPEAGQGSAESSASAARRALIRVLALPPGEPRWRNLERSFLHLWRIDSEED
jgi:beta-lactamase regulating signal transducer with metallopeptidase domain